MSDEDYLDDEDENCCAEDHEDQEEENDDNECADLIQTCSIGDMSLFYFSGMYIYGNPD